MATMTANRAAIQTRVIPTRDELDIMAQAAREFNAYGKTTIRCPRCGSEFKHYYIGTREIFTCTADNCIRIVARGI
ncbi:MAG: hypothetical protein LBM98_12775 [Oscillospiraceae bacterium]|jgi:formamidopyrimidine-DNA glycosylase|nr:hypothetical protein [Oscillospiraceae bacterium]